MPRLAALALMLLAVPAAAELYKVVGADGKIIYTDTPPNGTIKSISSVKIGYGSGTSSRSGLVLYSTASCGYCRQAKQYMATRGIAYTNVDIGADARGYEEYKRLGGHGVPFFVVDGRTMAGFGEEALEQLLQRGR